MNQEMKCSVTITEIHWERIYCTLTIQIRHIEEGKSRDLSFYLVDNQGCPKAELSVFELSPNLLEATFNITNDGMAECIPNGSYRVGYCKGGEFSDYCRVDEGVYEKVPLAKRIFIYDKGRNYYSVSFDISKDKNEKFLQIECFETGDTNLKKSFGMKGMVRLIYGVFERILPVNTRKVLFLSEQNEKIQSNLKAVSDKMEEMKYHKKYILSYSFRAATTSNQSIRSWLSLLWKLARCGIIILDDHAPILDAIILNKKHKIIQLWHGGAGFKSSGYSRWGHDGGPGPWSSHRQYTYGIAGSSKITHFFSEVWGINPEQVIPTGMPRMDSYLDPLKQRQTIETIYKKYPRLQDKKVILFAPTYRGENKKTAYYPYELFDYEELYKVIDQEHLFVFKMHPWIKDLPNIPTQYSDKIIDLSAHEDINELFYITELLITDYSSNIYEYSLMRKPMLFFGFDHTEYGESRGFHRDYESSAPGKVCYDFPELIKALKQKDFEVHKVDKYVKEHFEYFDSDSSERVIRWLIDGDLPEKYRIEIDRQINGIEKMKQIKFSNY